MNRPTANSGPSQRKSWLGKFLGFEVVVNDRRRPGRRGEGGTRRTVPIRAGRVGQMLGSFRARRRGRPLPLNTDPEPLDRPA
jgi:hypothetical protein